MSPDTLVDRRRFVKAVGLGGAAGLSGCIARARNDPSTVQIAGNNAIAESADDIESKLHEVGMSEDISLEVLAGAASTGARQQQYNRWLSANLDQPSLFMMDCGWTIPFIVRDQLVNLSEELPEVAETVESEYFERFRETAQDPGGDGGLYGVPLFPTTGNMLYRKDLVEEVGYDPEGEGWATSPISWQKFSQVAKEATEQTDAEFGFSFQGRAYAGLACCDFVEFAGSWGGSYFGSIENLFGPVGERPVTVDAEPVVRATRMLETFVEGNEGTPLDSVAGDISPRAVLQWQEETSRQPFGNGNAVMHRNWPYAIATHGAEDSFGEDLGVMPIPYGVPEDEAEAEGYGGSVSALGGWHVALNPNAANEEAAKEVLRAITTEEFQLFLFETLGYLPPRRSLYESDRAQEIDVMGRYLEQLRLSLENAIPRPVTVAWPQQSAKIAQQANAAFSGEKPPEQAMNELKRQLENIENVSEPTDRARNQSSPATGGG